MTTTARVQSPGRAVRALALLTFLAGAAGMAVSFLYLASDHRLDVLAGAAGFVAGSVLAASGLLSTALLTRPVAGGESVAPAADGTLAFDSAAAADRWVA